MKFFRLFLNKNEELWISFKNNIYVSSDIRTAQNHNKFQTMKSTSANSPVKGQDPTQGELWTHVCNGKRGQTAVQGSNLSHVLLHFKMQGGRPRTPMVTMASDNYGAVAARRDGGSRRRRWWRCQCSGTVAFFRFSFFGLKHDDQAPL